VNGEHSSVEVESALMLEHRAPQNIFSLNETALFYNGQSNGTQN